MPEMILGPFVFFIGMHSTLCALRCRSNFGNMKRQILSHRYLADAYYNKNMCKKKMPQFEGGYVSLNNGQNSVYNSTTEPTGPATVLETVKRVIGSAIGNSNPQDALQVPPRGGRPIITNAR